MAGDERVLVGRISAAHGIRGEVKIKSFTADPLDVAAYGPLETGDGRTLRIASARPGMFAIVARLEGIDTRTAAETLRGQNLYVKRAALPPAEEGEYYHADLIGLVVAGPDGRRLGAVKGVYDFGAGDLLDVAPDATPGKTVFVPFTDAMVPAVDLAARTATLSAEGVEVLAAFGPGGAAGAEEDRG